MFTTIRLLFSYFILCFTQDLHATSMENQEYGYYQFNGSLLPNFQEIISLITAKKNEMEIEKDSKKDSDEEFWNLYFKVDEVNNTISSLKRLKNSWGVLTHSAKYNPIPDLYQNSPIVQRGYREERLRYFINSTLLQLDNSGKTYNSREIDDSPEKETLFQALKILGIIKTNIPTTIGYKYSQKIAVMEILQENQNIHTLVLGCGSFLPSSSGLEGFVVCGNPIQYCASCEEMHHISNGELTVSLIDKFNPLGCVSDVIGDVADSCFWEGVREGLNGRKLDAIKDHTYYAGLHVSYDKNIGDILKTEARFEIAIDPYVKNIPELKGFTLKEESPWISPITGNTIQHWKSDMKLQVFTKD